MSRSVSEDPEDLDLLIRSSADRFRVDAVVALAVDGDRAH